MVVGLVFGVVGMFIIPVVGLFVGFAAGLLLSELQRTRVSVPRWPPAGRR